MQQQDLGVTLNSLIDSIRLLSDEIRSSKLTQESSEVKAKSCLYLAQTVKILTEE